MGSIGKSMAAILSVLVLAASLSDADAQTRRSSDVNRTRSSKQTVTRKSSADDRKPSTTITRPAPDRKQKPDRPESGSKPDMKPGDKPAVKPGDRPGERPGGRPGDRPGDRPDKGPGKGHDKGPGMKPGGGHGHGPERPKDARPNHRNEPPRVHPRDRDFMRWDHPSHWWSPDRHYYGYRVRVLPSHVHRHEYHGVVYYSYNDVWYRPYDGYYVVCRPPFGLVLAADIISDIVTAAVRIAYYNADQRSSVLADQIGTVQSYADVDYEYFYQDGVFYSKDASGEYKVILPPAGALVETLPEDFDTVTLKDGNEYYKVDDTIYKVTIVEGKPYFEVVGQQY